MTGSYILTLISDIDQLPNVGDASLTSDYRLNLKFPIPVISQAASDRVLNGILRDGKIAKTTFHLAYQKKYGSGYNIVETNASKTEPAQPVQVDVIAVLLEKTVLPIINMRQPKCPMVLVVDSPNPRARGELLTHTYIVNEAFAIPNTIRSALQRIDDSPLLFNLGYNGLAELAPFLIKGGTRDMLHFKLALKAFEEIEHRRLRFESMTAPQLDQLKKLEIEAESRLRSISRKKPIR